MRNYEREFENRVRFIKEIVNESGASGIVCGNSGGKDSALVGILCKAACENTLGLIMPCSSKRNFDMDKADGLEVAEKFGIETRITDLTP
ncbi:MAG: NAD(+) synthetase, partial [Clostridia bacterium]|nr:NAD(+) synthetase [Clostridia bacterium]